MRIVDKFGAVTSLKETDVAYIHYVLNECCSNKIILEYPRLMRRIRTLYRGNDAVDKLVVCKMLDDRIVFNILLREDEYLKIDKHLLVKHLNKIKAICIKNNIKAIALNRPNFWIPYVTGSFSVVRSLFREVFANVDVTIYMCYGG